MAEGGRDHRHRHRGSGREEQQGGHGAQLGCRGANHQNRNPRGPAYTVHQADPISSNRRAAHALAMGVRVAGGSVVGVTPLVHVRMRVLDPVVGVGMSVEVALIPADQKPDGEQDDHQTDRHICSPEQGVWKVFPEEHHGEPECHHRGCVPESPCQPQRSRPPSSVSPGGKHQSRHGSQVIGIGGVTEPQQSGQQQRHQAATPQTSQPFIESEQSLPQWFAPGQADEERRWSQITTPQYLIR